MLITRHIIDQVISFLGGKLILGSGISVTGTSGVVLVQLHELGEIELGLLEELDLPDHAVVLKREDLGAVLLDLFANVVLNTKS